MIANKKAIYLINWYLIIVIYICSLVSLMKTYLIILLKFSSLFCESEWDTQFVLIDHLGNGFAYK